MRVCYSWEFSHIDGSDSIVLDGEDIAEIENIFSHYVKKYGLDKDKNNIKREILSDN